jgi:hypothetical protein
MRAVLIAGAIVLLGASDAMAGPFCLVSAYGRNCSYFMLSDCQRDARPLDGACVANNEQEPPPLASTPPSTDGRAYGDVAGSFQRGYEASQRRRFDQETRELDIERQRLENERLRLSMPPPPPKPDEQSSGLERMARYSGVLRDMPANNRILAPLELDGVATAADLERCEPVRVQINQTRMARTQADLAQISALDEVHEELPYITCVFEIPQ